MGSSHLPPPHYSQGSYDSCDPEKELEQNSPPPTRKSPLGGVYKWTLAVAPLVLHGVVAIVIAVLMLCYVDGNHFNIKEWRPQLLLANGTTVQWVRRAPLQSEITTSISSSLAILRLITAAWLGPLSWRCAFILMENAGMQPRQLFMMIGYGIPLPRKGEQGISLFIWVILAIALPVHIISPVLTGSVTWVPHYQRMDVTADSTVSIHTLGTDSDRQWSQWNTYPPRREWTAIQAGGLASLAWGRDPQNDALKRVLPSSFLLAVNSTISNVTVPYFSVTKIEWIEDPGRKLTSEQLAVTQSGCSKTILYQGTECPLYRLPGTLALIPDTPSAWTNRSYTSPSIVSETRLMVFYAYWRGQNDSPCLPYLDDLHPNIGLHLDANECWAFAWVTYTAGVSGCSSCRLSSYGTVQNDTEL